MILKHILFCLKKCFILFNLCYVSKVTFDLIIYFHATFAFLCQSLNFLWRQIKVMVINIYGFSGTSYLLIILSQVQPNLKHYEVMMSFYNCGITRYI
jgi:hypothetical protein